MEQDLLDKAITISGSGLQQKMERLVVLAMALYIPQFIHAIDWIFGPGQMVAMESRIHIMLILIWMS